MKITINTEKKTIKVEENINLGKLYTELQVMLPQEKWMEYSIEVPQPPTYYPYNPCYPCYPTYTPYYTYEPIITCNSNNAN